MDRMISLTVITKADGYAQTFQDLSELGRNLTETHDYVNISCQDANRFDESDEDLSENLTYNENTMFKVRRALTSRGLSDKMADTLINEMQNAGILFRERSV